MPALWSEIVAFVSGPGWLDFGSWQKRLGCPLLSPDKILHHPVIWLLNQPLFWAAIGIGLGPYLFLRGFHLLKRKRMIEDIPRSTIRAAALGPVEISGKATGPYTLVSPIGNTDCYYYRVVLRVHRPGEKPVNTIVDEMCAPLFVDDGTGQLLVDPKGAELQFPALSAGGTAPDYLRHVLARHGYSVQDLQWAGEFCVQPGDTLFVLGTLRENTWSGEPARVNAASLSRIGPGFLSQAEANLERQEAFPYLHPDSPSRAAEVSTLKFDLHPPVILTKGASPFVISTYSEREVVSELNWRSVLYIWGGPAIALASLYEILTRLTASGLLRAR